MNLIPQKVIITPDEYKSFSLGVQTLLTWGQGKIGGVIEPGSIADKEATRNSDLRTQVSTAVSIGELMIDYGNEHLSAFLKIIHEPIEVFASLTCLRSMLESCAICHHLLDPGVTEKERVKRVYSYRIEGLVQQEKLNRAIKKPTALISSKMAKLRNDAKTVFLIHNIPCFPSATDLIAKHLGLGVDYRILSAVNHGHSWALLQLGFRVRPDGPIKSNTTAVEKSIEPATLVVFCMHAALAYARALWSRQLFCSNDSLALEERLEKVADLIKIKTKLRFWRSE